MITVPVMRGWMWLFGPLVLAGVALLVVVAIRMVGGGIGHEIGTSAPGRSRARDHGVSRATDYRYLDEIINVLTHRRRPVRTPCSGPPLTGWLK